MFQYLTNASNFIGFFGIFDECHQRLEILGFYAAGQGLRLCLLSNRPKAAAGKTGRIIGVQADKIEVG
jgi:hypothetical protein